MRLERAYRLWGSDVSADWTPLEAGMERFVDFNKGDFIGRDALLRQKEAGVEQPLYHPKNERLLGVKPDHRG
jgi:glycine cleavage system aminomethyltransferase T